MYDILRIFEVVSTYAQASHQPIGHGVSKKIRNAIELWKLKFVDADEPGDELFLNWKAGLTATYSMQSRGKQEEAAKLITQLDGEAKRFAAKLVENQQQQWRMWRRGCLCMGRTLKCMTRLL